MPSCTDGLEAVTQSHKGGCSRARLQSTVVEICAADCVSRDWRLTSTSRTVTPGMIADETKSALEWRRVEEVAKGFVDVVVDEV